LWFILINITVFDDESEIIIKNIVKKAQTLYIDKQGVCGISINKTTIIAKTDG